MLVLGRKVGERFWIGENIEIELVDIRGGKARIGIIAPRDVVVMRHELTDRKRQDSPDIPPGPPGLA